MIILQGLAYAFAALMVVFWLYVGVWQIYALAKLFVLGFELVVNNWGKK